MRREQLDQIILKNLIFFSFVGVNKAEKETGQRFELDLRLFCRQLTAVDTDELAETVNYAAVYRQVKKVVEAARYDLIERLAGAVIAEIFAGFPSVLQVEVTVRKPQAPLPGLFDYAAVRIFRERELHVAFLSLGANLGERQATLQDALHQLARHQAIKIEGVSSLYETTPVGVTEQPDFLNCVARIKTSLSPLDLLAVCQQTESSLGRVRAERWGPRTIDIDILTYDDLKIKTEQLTLPHPRMQERAFVKIPLRELQTGQTTQTDEVRLFAQDWFQE